MLTEHIEIQAFTIEGVKHYRARIQDQEWSFETRPEETLDQFRWRIMDTLHCGIITHFLEDWDMEV